MDRLGRITIAGRAFCLAAVLGLASVAGTSAALTSTFAVALIAAASVYVSIITPSATFWVLTIEALLCALVIGLGLPDALIVLPYIVVLSLVGGLSRGLAGATAVIVTLLSAIVLPSAMGQPGDVAAIAGGLAPWLLTSLGAGVLGAWVKQIGLSPRPVAVDAPYESARRLLNQLRTVARRLSAGLDPLGMSSQLLAVVHDHLHDTQSAVFVRAEGDVFSPLSYQGAGAREALIPNHPAIDECWNRMEPTHAITASRSADRRRWTVLPLRVESQMIGVVVSASGSTTSAAALTRLMREVDEHSIRIDTAMAFDEVRNIATADERRRLAREIHDGIAQEVASLGYVVDELVEDSLDTAHKRALLHLRRELTRVVSELRLSIFDLRSEIIPQSGLGAALSDYVRQVGSRSSMTVHITLDEAATRLTAGVEAELFRIAQEAITNARKHSEGRNLWVDCRVRPPFARIEISDDGRGLRKGRDDSFGLRIMQERAHRIDASLSVEAQQRGTSPKGTVVTVTLGEESSLGLVGEGR